MEANLHCVRNSYTVNANLVNSTVDGEKIDKVGTERVLAGKSDLEALGLDELDDLNGSLSVCQYGVRYRPRVCENAWALARPGAAQRSATHVDDVGHVLAMRMLAEVGRGANDDVKTIDTSLHGQTGIVHVAADVGQDLGLEAELADGLAILS